MTIGKRIKQARLSSGRSLRELAHEVGVSAMAISKYERDLDTPSSGVLLRLARTFGVKTEFFMRRVGVALSVPTFRKRVALPKKKERAILGQIQEWLERYLEVEGFLVRDAKPHQFSVPPGVKKPMKTAQDVERAAEALRSAWGLGWDPIENLTEVLEEKGIKVGMVDGDDHFDACTLWANECIPVIVIKRDLPGDRQRFDLAHELAHLVLQVKGTLDTEHAANRFAGAFIVPGKVARWELGEKRHHLSIFELHMLKHKYGVSMQAWIMRAQCLGIIGQSVANRMFKWLRSQGFHRQEPGDQIEPEQTTRLQRLVIRLLQEDIISEARAAELLGKPIAHFWRQVSQQHDGLPAFMRN